MAFNTKGLSQKQLYSIYNWREFLVPINKIEVEDGNNQQIHVLHQQQEEVKRDSNRYEFTTKNTNSIDSTE